MGTYVQNKPTQSIIYAANKYWVFKNIYLKDLLSIQIFFINSKTKILNIPLS